ncbi:MAG: YkgJ family cysteine cluster protein [Pyrinomonadaceae bacterium]
MEKPVQITRLPKGRFYEKIFEINERQRPVPSQIPLSRLSKLVSERVVTDASEPIPECVPCGACCVYGLVIPINRREPEPLKRYIEVTLDNAPDVVIERAFERDEADGRCVNMAGEVGVEIGCTVYPDRPQICRDFDAGSDRCFGYRRMYGIDPPLTEEHLATALEKLDRIGQPVKIRGIEIRLASKKLAYDRTATDPAKMMVEVLSLKIVAHMSDGEIREIHQYDPAEESWYEHELEGLTLKAALERIEQVAAH